MPEKKFAVQLPRTAFPMKADLPLREPEILALWERGLYARLQARAAERKGDPFVLHDGPPYANGPIHVGHALNKLLKDIIVKYKALRGFRAPFVPGWDCHGLPIEHQLMKEKGWDKRKVGRIAFRKEAARYAEHWIEVQGREFKRLGVLGDWDRPYKTLSPEYEAGIVRAFYDLFLKGFIARDKKPVHWCPSCETALAEAEVEYAEKSSPSIFVKFPIVQWPAGIQAPGRTVYALVWTTTPWTLPANAALAFQPKARYRVWESPNSPDGYLVGDPGWALLESRIGGGREAAAFPGSGLEGLLARNPLNHNDAQGILADFVSTVDGTGIVHIAPGHGADDYAAGKRYGLPVLSPVDERGCFGPDVLPNDLAGKPVWEADPVIVEKLKQARHLLFEERVTHSYPHCWRCKNPILFRAALQWFLKVTDEFRRALLESLDRVDWVPDYGKDRIRGMLESRPDWCLSRQRYWGTPIPMFLCAACGEPASDPAVFDAVVRAVGERGSDAWFEKDAAFFGLKAPCRKCGGSSFRKEEDILDVWFDSGVSWAAVLAKRPETAGTPRESVLYLEGSDQHRGWFQTSLLPAVALTKDPPYGRVLTHGFVLDGQGRAMSKSLGNVIAPQELVQKYGADIVRLWVSVTDYREDVRLSPDILARVADAYRKIRNTLRFLLGNLADFSPKKDALPLERMETLDLAALSALNALLEQMTRHFDRFEFHLVASALADQFCINALSEYYLDVRKDALYCDRAESPRRRSAQTAFHRIAHALSRALAPLLSFTAEESWQSLRTQGLLGPEDEPESVFLNPFPAQVPLPPGRFFVMADFLRLKKAVNESLEKARQSGAVKAANDAEVRLKLHPAHAPFAAMAPEELASVLGVARAVVEAGDGAPFEVLGIRPAPGSKCPRCWLWRELTDGLCGRCAEAEAQAAAR